MHTHIYSVLFKFQLWKAFRVTLKAKTVLQTPNDHSVYLTAIFSYFTLGIIFDIKQAHLDHCLLEIKEEHGLVQCIAIHNVPGYRTSVECLVRCENPILPQQTVVVQVIEVVPGSIEWLLCLVARAACSGQCLGKLWVQSWIRLVQSVLERSTSCHS